MTSLSRRRFTLGLGLASIAATGAAHGASATAASANANAETGNAGITGGSTGGSPAPARVTLADGRSVPAIGMGSWHLGQGRHSAQQETAALQAGIDLGMSLIDTAEMYGAGRSETLIGQAIKGQRGKVFLVSKIFPSNANRANMQASCNASLSRLGTDYLDLYLLHWQGENDIHETVEGFEHLSQQGKIRSWGVSNFDVDAMTSLAKLPNGGHCTTDQVLYNLDTRDSEFALLPWCQRNRMPIMAYSPLGSGSDLLKAPVLSKLAAKHGVTSAAIALAWSIRSGQVIAIPESGDPVHIRANAAALTLRLDASDLMEIDAAYPPPHQKRPLAML